MARAAPTRSKAARPQPRKGKPRARDAEEAPWKESEQRRGLHAQLRRTMGEFLDLSNVPERGRVPVVAKIAHRSRQGVSRWFKQDDASGALPDALSIFLFAQAFQADANYLFGLTDRRRVLAGSGTQAGQGTPHGNPDAVADLAAEIAERFPAGASITMVGDEMEPTIKRGTRVWLDSGCTAIQGNGLYALEVNGRTIVRIVEDRPGEGLTLSCENKRYREQVIPARADLARSGIKVLGKVVGWFQAP